MTRQRPSLRAPLANEDVRRFPAYVLAPARYVFRVVRDRHGPWWFSSALHGRFDLPAPEGTCYVASDDLGALLEIVGPDLLPGGCAPASLLAGRHLRRLGVPRTMRLADALASRAAQWVTAEIATITPYTVPQAWARTFRRGRWSGVRYAIRHSPSRTRASYALFGPAGERRRWPRGRRIPVSADHRDRLRTTCGITLFDRPSEEALVFAS